MLPATDNKLTPIRAGAVILASASVCPADPDLMWATLAGQPLLACAIATCRAVATLDPIILVVAPDRIVAANSLMGALVSPASKPGQPATRWRVVAPIRANLAEGVATLVGRRRDATQAGVEALAELAPDCEWVVVHEAARPLATAALIQAALATAVRANMGAIAVEPVKETLKRAPDGVGGRVAETLPRAQLARAQTPQAYRIADLLAALRTLPPLADPADEATIAFGAGLPLVTYPGGHDNLRATRRADLPIVAAALAERRIRLGAEAQ